MLMPDALAPSDGAQHAVTAICRLIAAAAPRRATLFTARRDADADTFTLMPFNPPMLPNRTDASYY